MAPAAVSNLVRVDQVGYLTGESKYGMVAGGAPTGAFDVRKTSDNSSVFSGTLAAAFADADSGDSIRTADFSALTTAGTYYLDVAGVGQSYNFSIADNAFQAAYVKAVRGFYGQRCGMAVNLGNVDGVTYQYPACHISGAASDNPATYHTSSGKTGTKNTSGGWHDAGDYGKYIVNSGISTGELLWTWEYWSDRLAGVSSNIPESGNGTPDVLNEARWNLQWMLKMQDTDGGVWHKNTSAGFGSFVLPNLDDSGTRYIIGSGSTPYKTSCSTADFAAVMAIAARLYQPYDATFAATCLTAAQNAYTWVMANPTVYFNNPGGISTGGYGDGNSTDERLWAAAELFHTTGNATYNTYVTSNTPGGTLFGTGLQQDWASVRNLALWTYYFSGQASADATLRNRIKADMVSAATTIANRTNGTTNGYKVSLSGGGQYIWGSNGAVANYGIFLLVADRMQPTASYVNAALNNLHYLLGRNTHNTSFVTHVGSKPFLHPHHRPSGDSAYSGGAPWPGLLSGGPNSSSTDGSGLDALPSNPPAKRWVDQQASYAGNEIAINWQAPLVFLLAYTLPVPVVGTPTRTPSFTASPTATPSPTPLPCGAPSNIQRVNVGGTLFTDGGGKAWAADKAYAAGSWGYVAAGGTSSSGTGIAGTADDALYQAQRYATNLQYRFTVPNGAYQVTLKLAETYWTGAGQRSFSVAAEGATVAGPLDLWSLAGANTAYDLSFLVTVSDGVLNLDFTSTVDNASVGAISVDTATGGPCATNTATPTATRTRTASITPTATPSGSPTRSATASASPTDAPTFSATPTATPSRSVSPSATRTATATATPSASPTATRSSTATPSASPTPSITLSETPPPPGSSDTPTPTISPTFSLTATPSATPTASPTATPSASASPSASPSPTATPSGTPSASPTGTPTASVSPTRSPSPQGTLTDSPTPTASASATPSATRTPSPAPTATRTPTATPSVSPVLPGPTATDTATPAPAPADDGPPTVEEAGSLPHPITGLPAPVRFKVRLSGSADRLRFRVYSRAMVLAESAELGGSFRGGWNTVLVPLPGLPGGTWYCLVDAENGGQKSPRAKPIRLVVLR